MPSSPDVSLIGKRYQEVFGARLSPAFAEFHASTNANGTSAALGYRRADEFPLFLEAYLDGPIEWHVGQSLGRQVARDAIVEIGNFASSNAMAMVALWGTVANDLAGRSEVAVATLTAPLRRMFARIGVPIHEITPAWPEGRIGNIDRWGSYYDSDPVVCCGVIETGQAAITRFLARRRVAEAA